MWRHQEVNRQEIIRPHVVYLPPRLPHEVEVFQAQVVVGIEVEVVAEEVVNIKKSLLTVNQ